MKLQELYEDIGLIDDHLITESQLYEMARIQPDDSGINVIMFVSTKKGLRHWARVKISNVPGTFSDTDNFSVSISRTPKIVSGTAKYKTKVIQDIFKWVRLNFVPLMKYWNDEYRSDAVFYSEIDKI